MTAHPPWGADEAPPSGGARRFLADEPAPHPRAGKPRRSAEPAYPPAGRPRRSADETGFGRSLGWAFLGTILPGAGLLRTRWRPLGVVLLALTLGAAALVAIALLVAPTVLVAILGIPRALTIAWVGGALYGVLWVFSIVATHLLLRPYPARVWQRVVGSVVVGFLALLVATPSFVGARTLYDTSQFLNAVLVSDNPGAAPEDDFGTVLDPWAAKERVNVLVLGGDAGADRAGTRTDTVILASIDTATGDMVLFSLPRQTQRMPFPAGSALAQRWPRGFTSGAEYDPEYALNAIYGNLPDMAPDAFPNADDPGAEALKMVVGEALGLKVDYYAMVNLDGFVELVDALGGITVNINQPVPVGGKNASGNDPAVPPDRWLPPGPDQHLDGYDALWFARGRYKTDDYHRMSRQRCVIQAVVRQADAPTVAANYEALTKAGSNIVATDVPTKRLPAMVTLGLLVKDATITSVSFESGKDGFSYSNPNWTTAQQRVQDAINPPAPTPTDTASTSSATSADPASPSADPASPSGTPHPEVIVDECAYNPVTP